MGKKRQAKLGRADSFNAPVSNRLKREHFETLHNSTVQGVDANNAIEGNNFVFHVFF